jgi:hypothetical protein
MTEVYITKLTKGKLREGAVVSHSVSSKRKAEKQKMKSANRTVGGNQSKK